MANNGIQINVSYNEVYFISTCTFKNFHQYFRYANTDSPGVYLFELFFNFFSQPFFLQYDESEISYIVLVKRVSRRKVSTKGSLYSPVEIKTIQTCLIVRYLIAVNNLFLSNYRSLTILLSKAVCFSCSIKPLSYSSVSLGLLGQNLFNS